MIFGIVNANDMPRLFIYFWRSRSNWVSCECKTNHWLQFTMYLFLTMKYYSFVVPCNKELERWFQFYLHEYHIQAIYKLCDFSNGFECNNWNHLLDGKDDLCETESYAFSWTAKRHVMNCFSQFVFIKMII